MTPIDGRPLDAARADLERVIAEMERKGLGRLLAELPPGVGQGEPELRADLERTVRCDQTPD